jgi:uncharacterized delta-60 repeat protein
MIKILTISSMLKFKLLKLLFGSSCALSTLAAGAEYRVDSTYATDGIFRQVGGAVKGVVVQSDGTILLGATMTETGGSSSSFGLMRQNSNGVFDSNFGSAGIRFTAFGANKSASVGGMAESPVDGKVILVGNVAGFNFSGVTPVYVSDFAVASFNADGSPDTGFNTTGKTSTSFDPIANSSSAFSYASAVAECVAVQADGKVVVGGWTEVAASDRRFAMVRYLTDGSIDSSFNGGYVITNPNAYCSMTALAISPIDQKIIAVGSYQDSSTYAYKNMVVRYNTDGTLDTSFDTDGIVLTGGGIQNHKPNAVAIQPDGKILVAGLTYIKNPFAEPEDFALFRYETDGTLDPNFGTGGSVAVDVVDGYDSLRAIKLQGDGKILVAGTAGGDPTDPSGVGSFALLMFNSDGSLDAGFGTDGMVASTGPSTREAYCIAQQTDGKIIAAGEFWGEGGNPGESAAIRFEVIPIVTAITRKTDLLLGLTSNAKLGSNIYNSTGAGQTQLLGIGFKATKAAYIGIQNDGSAVDSFKVKGTAGNSDFTVKYFKGKKDITSAIVAGSYQTPVLAVNATETLKVVVTAKSGKTAEKRTLTITASSLANPSASDKALIKASSKAKPK